MQLTRQTTNGLMLEKVLPTFVQLTERLVEEGFNRKI